MLDRKGEVNITFQVTNDDLSVLTLAVKTYLGYSEVTESTQPHVSAHSVPLLDDSFTVNFSMSTDSLVANVLNKIYF